MDINYTWKIADLFVAPTASGQTNVVLKASWELIGTHIALDGAEYSYTYTSTTVLQPYEQGAPFTSFQDLTPELVWSWVQAKENTKKRDINWIKNNLIAVRIDEKVNPKEIMIKNWSN
jgi:hypothetical protein